MGVRLRSLLSTATVETEILGDPIGGVWCEACALPSAVALPFALRIEYRGSTRPVLLLRLYQVCADCGEESRT